MRMQSNGSPFTGISQLSGLKSRPVENAFQFVTSVSYAVEIQRPHQKVSAAGFDNLFFHVQIAGMARDGIPAGIGMFEIRGFMHSKPDELLFGQVEGFAPSAAFGTAASPLPVGADPVSGHVGPFGAGVGNDALPASGGLTSAPPRQPSRSGCCRAVWRSGPPRVSCRATSQALPGAANAVFRGRISRRQ